MKSTESQTPSSGRRSSTISLLLAGVLLAGCSSEQRTPQILEQAGFSWKQVEADAGPIYVDETGFPESIVSSLAHRADSSMAAVLAVLGIDSYDHDIAFVYVDSRWDMERLVGQPVTGWAYVEDRTVVLVFNPRWRAFERHELTHVVAVDAWGQPGDPYAPTLEGLAVLVDGDCGGYPIGEAVRTMLDRDLLLTLAELLGDFRLRDDLVAYLQAASLYEFALSRPGGPDLARVWSEGLGAVPQILGVSQPEMETSWRSWILDTFEPLSDVAWSKIRERGCGIAAKTDAE